MYGTGQVKKAWQAFSADHRLFKLAVWHKEARCSFKPALQSCLQASVLKKQKQWLPVPDQKRMPQRKCNPQQLKVSHWCLTSHQCLSVFVENLRAQQTIINLPWANAAQAVPSVPPGEKPVETQKGKMWNMFFLKALAFKKNMFPESH